MKKIILILFAIISTFCSVFATPISSSYAKTIAENFYKRNVGELEIEATLSYTGYTNNGQPAYFVFNINNTEGFVIVSADDVTRPIIGYSNEGKFELPPQSSNIEYWLNLRKKEVEDIRAKNLTADQKTVAEWNTYSSLQMGNSVKTVSVSTVAPLLGNIKWNQSPYYNDQCPGGSVTGCVATAMAQIMRYWNYPSQGTGSNSYNHPTYGTLSANFGATTYSWTAMPTQISSANAEVAKLNYHVGVSVKMNYSPSGSSSKMIDGSDPAKNALVQYFKYDPNTIQGLYRNYFSDSIWIHKLKTDLDNQRPIQYAGYPTSGGGHCWVLDGYDASLNFHMNWGWGGSNNGYFSVNSSNGSNGFNIDQQALLGIQPRVYLANDIAVRAINSPVGLACNNSIAPVITIANCGTVTLTSCKVNYHVDNGANQIYSWSGSLASNQTTTLSLPAMNLTLGTHTIYCATSNPNGSTDGNLVNDDAYVPFNINTNVTALPLLEGFESSSNLPTNWTIVNPDGDAAWQVTNMAARTGLNCIGFNNCNGTPHNAMSKRKDWFHTQQYNFSAIATPTLSFDVAYCTLTYQGGVEGDTLAIYYSTNCGSTWNMLYKKGGANLATAPTNTAVGTCWKPTSSSQWRKEGVNLNALTGQSSVVFAFENISEWGQWLFLDNINISGNTTTGINTLNKVDGVVVYPNPAVSSFAIEAQGFDGKLNYSLTDIAGRELKSGEIISTNGIIKETIDVTDFSKGIYFLQLRDGVNTYVRKINVQ